MLQEDSNGESSFEIIEKKTSPFETKELPTNLSSVSPPYTMQPVTILNPAAGNLLSNVKPPSTIPDFTLWSSPTVPLATNTNINTEVPFISSQASQVVTSAPLITQSNQTFPPTLLPNITPISTPFPLGQISVPSTSANFSGQPVLMGGQFPTPEFSAAIPPGRGVPYGSQQQSENEIINPTGGFMNLVKGAFSGNVLSKMAEKAKSSVDSIITTLDPQMSEYIYSGGDVEVTVTSKNEEEVGAIREAFHSVLGKAWINGVDLNAPLKTLHTVGIEEGVKNALEKIEYSLKYRNTPTVAVENILLEQNKNYFDLNVVVLKDTERQILVQTWSQAIPVPAEEFLRVIEKERPDYTSKSIEEKLTLYFQTHPNWQFEVSGVTRKEILSLAGRVLVSIYKNKLGIK